MSQDANTWSTVDVFSDNIFADIIKRDSLQKAQEHLQMAQSKIERFEIELKDVTIGIVELPEISDFDYVIDVWFDNIFTDYSIKSKIKQSLDKVNYVLSTVETLLNDLNNQRKEVNNHLEDTLKKLKNLLTTL